MILIAELLQTDENTCKIVQILVKKMLPDFLWLRQIKFF